MTCALEGQWRGEVSTALQEETGRTLRAAKKDAGLDYVTMGDFDFYDQVANHIQLLGCEPAGFQLDAQQSQLRLLQDGARRRHEGPR